MPPELEAQIGRLVAQHALLMQEVRLMKKELAFAGGLTPEDVMRSGEAVKQFFETRLPPGLTEMQINAEVDAFYTLLATELQQMQSGS